MITLHTNLKNGATTQLTDYNFNSYCKFGDVLLCCNQSGVDKIDFTGLASSLFETFATNLDWPGNKRKRFIYLSVETEGTIIITPVIDGNDGTPVTFTPNNSGRQYMKMTVNHDLVGGMWGYRVENVDGCWFAVNEISVLPTYLSKSRVRPRS